MCSPTVTTSGEFPQPKHELAGSWAGFKILVFLEAHSNPDNLLGTPHFSIPTPGSTPGDSHAKWVFKQPLGMENRGPGGTWDPGVPLKAALRAAQEILRIKKFSKVKKKSLTGKCEYSEGQRALSKMGAIVGGASSWAVLRRRSGQGLVIVRGEFSPTMIFF